MILGLLRRKPWHARDVDPAMLGLVAVNGAAAVALGWRGGLLSLALEVALGSASLALLPVLLGGRGQAWRSRGVALALGCLVALQIHLARGALELHFNVFVTLGLMLAYRDWRPVALLTGFFAVHHIAFDRLLQSGIGTYCLSQPDPQRIALQVIFVAVMGLTLARVAWSQARDASEARELEFLVKAMGLEGPIRLQLDVVRVSSTAAKRLRQVQQRMAQVIAQLREAAQSVRQAAERSAVDGGELMERTQTTAAGLKDAAMCLEQISVIVQGSNDAASQAKGLSHQATTMADEGGRMVADVVRSMQEIEVSSRRISDIVGVIDGIAFQTNILALNAAVEAARAGEQGRGFAVVAAEVRSLAQRSASAAREIKTLVAASQATVERGVSLVGGTGERMEGLVDTVRQVGKLFDDITADASNHAQGLQMVTQSVDSLGDMTQSNQALAERSAETAQALQAQLARLDEVLGVFKIGHLPAASATVAVSAPRAAPVPPAASAARSAGSAPSSRQARAAGPARASEVEYF
jgi:methyl-accepting chemotaxis protein